MRWKLAFVALITALGVAACGSAGDVPRETGLTYGDYNDYPDRYDTEPQPEPAPYLELECNERFIMAGTTTYVLMNDEDWCDLHESIRTYKAKTKKKVKRVIADRPLKYGTAAYWAVMKYLGTDDPLMKLLLQRDKAHRQEIKRHLAGMKRPARVPERLFTKEEAPAEEPEEDDSSEDNFSDEDRTTVRPPKIKVCVSRNYKTQQCNAWTTI